MNPSFSKILKTEPSFREVAMVALKNQGVDSLSIRSWEKQIRRSAILPKLYVGYDYQNKFGESLSITDNISVTSSGITVGPEDNDLDYDQDSNHVLRVRGVWDLNNLIFNRDLLAHSKHRADLVKTRRILTDQIYDLYEKRYLFLSQYFEYRFRNRKRARTYYLKYALLTQKLNEMTNGQFEQQFWRKK